MQSADFSCIGNAMKNCNLIFVPSRLLVSSVYGPPQFVCLKTSKTRKKDAGVAWFGLVDQEGFVKETFCKEKIAQKTVAICV